MTVYFLGLIQFIVIVYICYFEFKLKSPVVFLWATLFIMFGIMHLFSSLNGDILYTNDILYQASLFTLLFCLLYLFTRILLVKLLNKKNYDILEYESLQNACMSEKFPVFFFASILLAVVVLRLIPFIQNSGGWLYTSWSSGRSYSASLDYVNIRHVYSNIYYAFSGLALCSLFKEKNKITFFILLMFAVSVLLTRNRM